MTTVRARLAPGRSVTFDDLTDGAVEARFGADGMLEVTVTPDVPPAVAAAIRVRIISQSAADEAIRCEIVGLLAESPSDARTAALVEALARLALEVP